MPEEFVDPIIRTIFAQQQGVMDKAKQVEAERKNKEEERLNREKVKQQDDQFKQEQELHKMALELSQHQFKQQTLEHEHAQKGAAFDRLAKTVAAGGQPPEGDRLQNNGSPKLLPYGTYADPTDSTIQFAQSLFPTADTLANNEANKAGLIMGAQRKAIEPYAAADDARTGANQLALDTQKSRELQLQKDADHKFEVEQTRFKEGQANWRTQVAAKARLQSPESDPIALGNAAEDIYINGTGKMPAAAKAAQAIRGSVPPGWTPIAPTDATHFNNITKIDKYLSIASELADLKGTAGGRASAVTGGSSLFGGNSEAYASKLNTLNALAGDLTRSIGAEKSSVLSDNDIKRIQNLYSDKFGTVKAAKKTIDEVKGIYKTGTDALLKKYPADQRDAILRQRNVDPSQFIKEKTAIQLDDGTVVADTPENRRLHGIKE